MRTTKTIKEELSNKLIEFEEHQKSCWICCNSPKNAEEEIDCEFSDLLYEECQELAKAAEESEQLFLMELEERGLKTIKN